MTQDAAEDLQSKPGRVLIVDDQDAVRRAHTRLLSKAGYVVESVGSAEQALKLLRGGGYDVVFSDVQMPTMNGVDLLRLVRDFDGEVSVVLLSGAPDLPTALKAVEFGAIEYLTKPIDRDRLLGAVARAAAVCRDKRRLKDEIERFKSGERLRQSHVEPAPLWTGALVGGRYRLGQLIGEGGMGAVYEGTREDLGGMPVAVKIVHPELQFDRQLLMRLRREAEIMASIDHPNVVKILDFQSSEEGPAILVMELLHGAPLAETIAASGGLSQPRVISILQQILSGLAAAHERGVVHRDLKPENVFLTKVAGLGEVVRVLDFGIAKLTGTSDVRLTHTGATLGTPAYMAPEQARGQDVNVRTDIYAVGCIAYEMLTARAPFHGESYNAVLAAILEGRPLPIEKIRTDVPAELIRVITKAMSRAPTRRYQNATEMSKALGPWATIAQTSLPPAPAPASAPHAPTLLSDAPGSMKRTRRVRKR